MNLEKQTYSEYRAMNPDNPTRFCDCGNPPSLHSKDFHATFDNPPTTGEWTAESVMRMFGWRYKKRAEAVAKAHNAALAAEQQKTKSVGILADQFQKQLAAEREKREDSHICDLCGGVIKRGKHFCTSCAATQQEQLAAEQEKPKTTEYAQGWDDHVLAARSQIEDLKDQLAAEQKKVERMSKAYMACNQDWQDVTAQLALIEAHARQLSNIPVEQTYENLAWKDFQQLKHQLAVAVEALKAWQNFPHRVSPHCPDCAKAAARAMSLTDAAVAKIGVKP